MRTDLAIVGSGIAGLYVGLKACSHYKVTILTKGSIDECNTKYAQGGIAAPIGEGDSPELHYRDTIAAGCGLCKPEAVRILVDEAVDRIHDLIDYGIEFDTVNGEIALAREGAHSVPRVIHAGGDATGARIEGTLSRLARKFGIKILERHLVTKILVKGGAAVGVRALDCATGSAREIESRWTVLATGGAGHLFKYSTNPEVATGGGVALAYDAGAIIADMEFFQFHPTALAIPGAPQFLISEAVRGEGGILRNVSGERFMHRYHEDGELASRDVVSRSIASEMSRTGADHVFLDLTHLPRRRVVTRFPNIYRFCIEHGLDITRKPIPVAPAAHYMVGGVSTNLWGETSVKNLFACGEVACTGVHGANRLASNSLLEVLVFGKRIVDRVLEGSLEWGHDKLGADEYIVPIDGGEDPDGEPSVEALRELLWRCVGIKRRGEKLLEAGAVLGGWSERLRKGSGGNDGALELGSMVLVARLMAKAALTREESRGCHFREDFPTESPRWLTHIAFVRGGEGL
ncbi:MAG: L-aspartate oxidase [Candidatus Brockarchaeota archaeon]|nr:L-aspartate oxidase [Candidatus Brockarchaeota archaeon]